MIFSGLHQKSLEEVSDLGYAQYCHRADKARSDAGPPVVVLPIKKPLLRND
jgi:hypothetical protein